MFKRTTAGGRVVREFIQVPILPPRIILRDREDDTRWTLSYNLDDLDLDGFGYFAITDVINLRDYNYTEYSAFDGPKLGEYTRIRLLIRDGHLGYEDVLESQGIADYNSARITARNGNRTDMREIVVPDSWTRFGDALAWQTVAA